MKTNNQIELQIELHYSTFILQGLNFSIKKKKKADIFVVVFLSYPGHMALKTVHRPLKNSVS